jgi:PadR family transcriptional regulator PadR
MPPTLSVQTQAVLAAMLSDPTAEHYGLELARQAGLKSGTVYPILARLERAGWIESAWEDVDPAVVGRRARRYYRLTGDGALAAHDAIEETVHRLHGVPAPRPRPRTAWT